VLVALSVSDHRERWRAALPGGTGSSPLVYGGQVVVGANDRSLHGFDTADGEPQWTMPTGDAVVSSPVAIGDVIVVGSDDGTVYGVRP